MSEHIQHLVDDYCHGLLDGTQRADVERHVATCSVCRDALAAARSRWELLHRAKPPLPNADAVQQRVTHALHEEHVHHEQWHQRRRGIAQRIGISVAVAVLLLASVHLYFEFREAAPWDVRIDGQHEWLAGSQASLRVQVLHHGQALAAIPVTIALHDAHRNETVELARFTTDEHGTGQPRLQLPEWANGSYTLRVAAETPNNAEVARPVTLRRLAKVMISSDKPVYQPGQTIHVRALGLNAATQKPMADTPAKLTVTDAKGNLIFKHETRTSAYGIVHADCELAGEVLEGRYHVNAQIGETSSKLAVQVETYVLPKFKIELALDRPHFKPGEPITGLLQVRYFHGEPVQGTATLSLHRGGPSMEIPVRGGQARVQFAVPPETTDDLNRTLNVEVRDTAAQQHALQVRVPAASRDLLVRVESVDRVLVPGVPSQLLFRVTRPNGTPVQAELHAEPFTQPLTTNSDGIAWWSFTPTQPEFSTRLTIHADTQVLHEVVQLLPATPTKHYLVLTGRRTIPAGTSLTVHLHGPEGIAFVDVLRLQQTVLTQSVNVVNQQATLTFDLPADWAGPLELVAYQPHDRNRQHMGRTTVQVTQGDGLTLTGKVEPVVEPAWLALVGGTGLLAPETRPGTAARVNFTLRDANGKPTAGAISLTAVDEAVFHVRPKESTPATENTSSASPLYSLQASSYTANVQQVRAQQRAGLYWVRIGWFVVGMVGMGLVVLLLWPVFQAMYANLLTRIYFGVLGIGVLLFFGFVVLTMSASLEKKAAMQATMESIAGSKDGRADALRARMEAGHLREEFPETLVWQPELLTDDRGQVSFPFRWADNITTWQFTASAVDARGQQGAWQHEHRVFQPFFVDVNLPVALTRNDRITVPVVVSNYAPTPQTIRVSLEGGDAIAVQEPLEQTLTLQPKEVRAVPFPVHVRRVGRWPLTIRATSSNFTDAVRREITVHADGTPHERVVNGSLDQPATVAIDVPNEAIEGSPRATLKLYPSGFSQLVEGLDGIFREPHGCFEQTSSTTYPNVLALAYLAKHHKAAPEVEAKARRLIQTGYQRLLTFEVAGGGFDWYGRGPANRSLTAYGLMQFRDMATVAHVDPEMIQRTRRWLLEQRKADGSWEPDGSPRGAGALNRRLTAYIAWAIFDEQHRSDAATTLQYLQQQQAATENDPYVVALMALALRATGGDASTWEARLLELKVTEAEHCYWAMPTNQRGVFYGSGTSGHVEATALALLALQADGANAGVVRQGLTWLTKQRTPTGTWGTTQATILALKALLNAAAIGGDVERRFTVLRNGQPLHTLTVPANQSDVLQQRDLTPHLQTGANTIEVRELTRTSTTYQVTWKYHTPTPPPASESFGIQLDANRKTVGIGETLALTAAVANRSPDRVPMLLVQLPVPAGFALASDPQEWVKSGQADRVERHADRLVIYVRALEAGANTRFPYTLKALAPATVTVPSASVHEYYNPTRRATSPLWQATITR